MFSNLILIIYGAMFICILLLIEGLYYLIADKNADQEKKTINRRMRWLSQGVERTEVRSRLRRKSPEELTKVSLALLKIPPLNKLEGLLARAGLSITTLRFVMYLVAGFAGILAIFNMILHLPVLSAIGLAGTLAIAMPIFFVAFKGKRRVARLENQLPEALDMIVRSLRAGHPITTAISLVSREMPDPLGSEFGLVSDEMTFGLDLQHALEHMNTRLTFPDMRFVILSVKMQSQTGGNLAEVLGVLARLIRERHRLHLKVMGLAAEGRFSVKILGSLPFGFFGVISFMSPKYFSGVSADPTLAHLIEGAMVFLMIGLYLMRRIVNFRV